MIEETIDLDCPDEIVVALPGSDVIEVEGASTTVVEATGSDVTIEMPGYAIELNSTGGGAGNYEEDDTLPPEWLNPAPPPVIGRNLTALNGFTTISLYWSIDWYGWHRYTEVWRSEVDDIATARKVGAALDNAYTDSVETGKDYFYWIRPVTQRGVVGDWNALAGTPGNSREGIDGFLEGLRGKLHEGLFDQTTQGAFSELGTLSSQLLAETQQRIAAIADQQAERHAELNQWLAALRAERSLEQGALEDRAITAVHQETLQRSNQYDAFVIQLNDMLAALTTERDQRIAAITEERQALTNSNLAQATVNQELTALLDSESATRMADIEEERLVRIAELESMAQQIQTISAATNTERSERIAAIQEEQSVRTTELDAVAEAITSLDAAIVDEASFRAADITTVTQAIVDGDSSLATRVDTLQGHLSADNGPVYTFDGPAFAWPVNTSLAGAVVHEFSVTAGGPCRIAVQVTGAEGGAHVALNGVDLGTMTGPELRTQWHHFFAEITVTGTQQLAFWADTPDDGTIDKIIVTGPGGAVGQSVAQDTLTTTVNEQGNTLVAEGLRLTELETTVNTLDTTLSARITAEENTRVSEYDAMAELVTGVTAEVAAKPDTYSQATAPVGAKEGDYWYDTTDKVVKRFDGTQWAVQAQSWEQTPNRPTNLLGLDPEQNQRVLDAFQVANSAQSTADGKIETFYQTIAPDTDMSTGDLWFDTDNGNKLHRWDGTQWVDAQDSVIGQAVQAAETAQSTADGKITTYFGESAPASEALSLGDLWYSETTKELRRWDVTSWVVVSNAINDTLDLTDSAGLGQTADWGQVSGTGKPSDGATVNHTFAQPIAPSTGMVEGDFWIDTDNGNHMYRFNGTLWEDVQDADAKEARAKVTEWSEATAGVDPVTGELVSNAIWEVSATADDQVGSIGLVSDGQGGTEAYVKAGKFQVYDPAVPATKGQLFVVENGNVYMNTAFIKDAYIQNLVAAGITAEKVNALELDAINISGGQIQIGGRFSVDSGGNLQASNGTFSGTINGSNINGASITGGFIKGAYVSGSYWVGDRTEVELSDYNQEAYGAMDVDYITNTLGEQPYLSLKTLPDTALYPHSAKTRNSPGFNVPSDSGAVEHYVGSLGDLLVYPYDRRTFETNRMRKKATRIRVRWYLWGNRIEYVGGYHKLRIGFRITDKTGANIYIRPYETERRFNSNTNRHTYNGVTWAYKFVDANGFQKEIVSTADMVINYDADDQLNFYMTMGYSDVYNGTWYCRAEVYVVDQN